MMAIKKLFLPVFIMLICGQHSDMDTARKLSGKKMKYWDARTGHCWMFRADSVFIEFEYAAEDPGLIRIPDYGDVVMGEMNWFVKKDTLCIRYAADHLVRYPILKLNEKELIVKDPSKAWGVDSLFFFPSGNQSPVFQK